MTKEREMPINEMFQNICEYMLNVKIHMGECVIYSFHKPFASKNWNVENKNAFDTQCIVNECRDQFRNHMQIKTQLKHEKYWIIIYNSCKNKFLFFIVIIIELKQSHILMTAYLLSSQKVTTCDIRKYVWKQEEAPCKSYDKLSLSMRGQRMCVFFRTSIPYSRRETKWELIHTKGFELLYKFTNFIRNRCAKKVLSLPSFAFQSNSIYFILICFP